MAHDGSPTYAELSEEVRRLRERAAQLEALAGAPSEHDLLQMVMDHLPQSLCWKDRNSVFLGCNLAFARSLGARHPSDLIGKTDYDLPSAAMADAYRADDRQTMESGIAKINFE